MKIQQINSVIFVWVSTWVATVMSMVQIDLFESAHIYVEHNHQNNSNKGFVSFFIWQVKHKATFPMFYIPISISMFAQREIKLL